MKLVYVSSCDSEGQRFNGVVLHRALNRMGHSSHFATADRVLSDEGIHSLGGPVLRLLNKVAANAERRLSLQSTLPVLGLSLRRQQYFLDADVIHLQLLHARSFLSLFQLTDIANGRRPVVWTIHDPWITTGHCVHPLGCQRWEHGCGQCPDLTIPLPIERDSTAMSWRIKRRVLRRARIHLVVASKWMQRRLGESPIVGHLPSTVIPFGVDRGVFRPRDKAECRRKLGIPADARVVAFRWAPWSVFKGTQYAMDALGKLPPGVVSHVISFQSTDDQNVEPLRGKYRFVHLGWVDNDEAVAVALNAADVFVMPSIAESFGMMAVESMACGTPVVVFEGTSLPEVVESPRAGLAVPQKDSEALARAIQAVFQDSRLRQSLVQKGLELVAREYTAEAYLQRHLELYESLLSRKNHAC